MSSTAFWKQLPTTTWSFCEASRPALGGSAIAVKRPRTLQSRHERRSPNHSSPSPPLQCTCHSLFAVKCSKSRVFTHVHLCSLRQVPMSLRTPLNVATGSSYTRPSLTTCMPTSARRCCSATLTTATSRACCAASAAASSARRTMPTSASASRSMVRARAPARPHQYDVYLIRALTTSPAWARARPGSSLASYALAFYALATRRRHENAPRLHRLRQLSAKRALTDLDDDASSQGHGACSPTLEPLPASCTLACGALPQPRDAGASFAAATAAAAASRSDTAARRQHQSAAPLASPPRPRLPSRHRRSSSRSSTS